MRRLMLFLLFLCLVLSKTGSADVRTNVPDAAQANRKYIFYLHGAWIEKHGLNLPNPRHGYYEYHRIVAALADKGYEVVSELRLSEVHPPAYARGVADQVRSLLENDVPPENITVSGHSKGGQMALIVSSLIAHPRVNYVVLAGCGKRGTLFRRSFEKFLQGHASLVRGRVLSIYDASDFEAGSCQEVFDAAHGTQTTKEITLHTGKGHGLFYAPNPVWIEPLFKWSQQN